MTNNTNNQIEVNETQVEQAQIRQSKRISPFWLLPIIALCIGAILFFQIIKEQGETIHITFARGDGLVANKTQVRYQGLQIGVVKKVNFTDDMKQVEVEASIYPEAKNVLRENTRFWLVQPSASLAGISGLDTLISGNYITLQPGDGDHQYNFVAENKGSNVQLNDGDLLINLLADDLGSISSGASVYYKKMAVGKVYDYHFTKDRKQIEIQVVIDKNYADLVKKDSRFWNISGFRANINASGLKVSMDSLNSIVQGAIAFDSPEDSPVAQQDENYKLYSSLSSAKRGIEVKVTVPNEPGLQVDNTAVFLKNVQVGTLIQLDTNNLLQEKLNGVLLIDPNEAAALNTGSQIVLRQPEINLANLKELPSVFRGNYFEIIPGNSPTPQKEFNVVRQNELLLQQPNALVLELTAPETYGVADGQPIYYNSIVIGQIAKQHISAQGVKFTAAISAEYRYLIHSDSKFVAASNLDVSLGVDGVRFQSATPEHWLQGGVRVIAGEKEQGQALTHYPLYANQDNAEIGDTGSQTKPNITLTTPILPNISKGSLVLYRQFEVGKISDVRPTAKNFEVDVSIYPKYRSLLTDHGRFWVESAAQIDITPKGISVQASPLGRSLKGAISFDNNGSEGNKTLYSNELRAKSAGQVINLTADNATNLSKGMALRYRGLDVGEVESINLDQHSKKFVAKALMNPDYMKLIAHEGSQFSVISPQISAGGIENIDSLLKPYIDIDAGEGKVKTQFALTDRNSQTNNRFNHGFPILLEANDVSNLSEGSPVLYRGIEVGKIRSMELNKLGDRVILSLTIGKNYQHLVRQNSEFWRSSGYDLSFGWSGMNLNTGTVKQLLKGGISFGTPSGQVVQPRAQANQRFLLQTKRPDNQEEWNQGVIEDQPTQNDF